MTSYKLKTPIVFVIFNRPDATEKVFSLIRQARPYRLLIIADGPRVERPGEAEKCTAARAVVERIDWDCEVLINYSDVNLGCRRRVSSGLDWAFSTVEEAIILEDDCLPHPTFFRFCEELLEKYRDDERIMAISGDNFQFGRSRTEYSYYFSRYNHCWGWAGWRRAWQHYDVDMKLWPRIRDSNLLIDLLSNSRTVNYWHKTFQDVYDGQIGTWDFQWTFACWIQNGLTILPSVNLVSNIGFYSEATHTTGGSQFANIPVEAMRYPLNYPPFVIRDITSDDFTQKTVFDLSLIRRIEQKIYRILKK